MIDTWFNSLDKFTHLISKKIYFSNFLSHFIIQFDQILRSLKINTNSTWIWPLFTAYTKINPKLSEFRIFWHAIMCYKQPHAFGLSLTQLRDNITCVIFLSILQAYRQDSGEAFQLKYPNSLKILSLTHQYQLKKPRE